jgi:hypothetical protein
MNIHVVSVGLFTRSNVSKIILVKNTIFTFFFFCYKNWYCLSKTIAEREALDFASKTGLDLVTVCPTLVIGPMLQSTINASSLVLINLLEGKREFCFFFHCKASKTNVWSRKTSTDKVLRYKIYGQLCFLDEMLIDITYITSIYNLIDNMTKLSHKEQNYGKMSLCSSMSILVRTIASLFFFYTLFL